MFDQISSTDVRTINNITNVIPYPHQLAEMHAMLQFEKSTTSPILLDSGEQLRTQVGIMGDKPGSGKSMTVLMHVAAHPRVYIEKRHVTQFEYINVSKFTQYSNVVDTNVFLVPRTALTQWVSYTNECMSDVSVFSSTKLGQTDAIDIFAGKYDVVFLTNLTYKDLMQLREVHHLNATFQRLVIDEADSILAIPAFVHFDSLFTWYVTSLPAQLLFKPAAPRVHCHLAPVFHNKLSLGCLMIKATDAFIDDSLSLPRYAVTTLNVQRPFLSHGIFANIFAIQDLMHAIATSDINTAISRIGCKYANKTNVVDIVTHKYRQQINELLSVPGNDAQIGDVQNTINAISARINQSEKCPISWEAIVTPTIVPCCHNTFDFHNLMKSQMIRSTCPMCNTPINLREIVVVNTSAVPGKNTFANKNAALKNIMVEALKTKNAKILIFSEFAMTIVDPVCAELGVIYKEIKGCQAQIEKTMNSFRSGDLQVLLLNVSNPGDGTNLECATHVIAMHYTSNDNFAQQIGRAQRPGRSTPLSVYRILFEDESF